MTTTQLKKAGDLSSQPATTLRNFIINNMLTIELLLDVALILNAALLLILLVRGAIL